MGGDNKGDKKAETSNDLEIGSTSLLDALPKYIEAQVEKEMLAHLKDYHNMSIGIDDIIGCCDTIRNFEKDLSLYSKSIYLSRITCPVLRGKD